MALGERWATVGLGEREAPGALALGKSLVIRNLMDLSGTGRISY